MRLTTRIIGLHLAVQVVSLGGGAWLVHREARSMLRNDFAVRVETIAQAISASVSPLMCQGDRRIPEKFLERVADEGQLAYAIIRSGDRVLASAGDVSKVLRSFQDAPRLSAEIERSHVFATFATIPGCPGGREAELEIGVDFRKVDQPTHSLLVLQLATLLIQIVLAAILTILMSRLIGRRIIAIEQTCERISLGDFEARAEEKGRDEFSAVTGAINQMSRKLQRLSAERDRQRQELASSAKLSALGEMAGGVAHEINNPLSIIAGRVEQLRRAAVAEPFDREKTLNLLERVSATVERIAKIVRGLRVFSRSADTDPKQTSNLKDIVQDSLELCTERFRNSGIELRLDLGPNLFLSCRSTQLSQVIINLLNNAFDAVQPLEEKWVEIKVERLGESHARLAITDSGSGIPGDVLDRIMDPFFTTKPIGKGTGLGLSISKGIVEDHGGRLYVDGQCPHTRFCMEFPTVVPGAQTSGPAQAA